MILQLHRAARLHRAAARGLTSLPLPPLAGSTSRPRLTICLDLDECLVHSQADAADIEWKERDLHVGERDPFAAHAKASARPPPDFELELPYVEAPVRVWKRPAVDDFLAEASKLGELVVFTSAAEGYATELMAQLDPQQALVSALLSRRQCRRMEDGGSFAKDLGALGRPLERTVLVDDSSASFVLQPDNAIPVPPFFGGPSDATLSEVLQLLRVLDGHDDVRPHLRQRYGVREKLVASLASLRAEIARNTV